MLTHISRLVTNICEIFPGEFHEEEYSSHLGGLHTVLLQVEKGTGSPIRNAPSPKAPLCNKKILSRLIYYSLQNKIQW